MTSDAFPNVSTDDIDGDEPAETGGVGQLFDLRLIDAMCRATGRDTMEYVEALLAIMHGHDDAESA